MEGRNNRKNKFVEDKVYGGGSSKNFTCISTPGFNALATGSDDGNIRLYNDITKNAKIISIKGLIFFELLLTGVKFSSYFPNS